MAVRAKKLPSAATKMMLTESNIALWDACHYTTTASAHPGRPTSKDPVRVVLVTPLRPDRLFSGVGEDADAAVKNALESNAELRTLLGGVTGALGKLEMALAALDHRIRMTRYDLGSTGGLDDDIPF